MASRKELQEQLCQILGTRNVYFQPPESVKIQYPCFVYKLSSIDTKVADDKNYLAHNKYEVTFIDRKADTTIPMAVLETFNKCTNSRIFTSDNLYHYVFTLFY